MSQTHESTILALPDELLDIITTFSRESVAFLVSTCSRLWKSECRTRPNTKRMCELHSAFYSSGTLREALHCIRFRNLVQGPGNKWNTVAHAASIRVGDEDVLKAVLGIAYKIAPLFSSTRSDELSRLQNTRRLKFFDVGSSTYIRHICYWNRIDIILSNLELNNFCQKNMRKLSCQSDSGPYLHEMRYMQPMGPPYGRTDPWVPIRFFISHVIVPAFWGGSIDVLKWLFNILQRSKLGQDCTWTRVMLTRTSRVPRVLVRAAQASTNSEHALEFLSTLFCDVLPNFSLDCIRRHVAAIAITMAKQSVSIGTLRFAKKISTSLASLMTSVNSDIENGISFVHRCDTHVAVSPFILASKNKHTYEFMRSEMHAGGWMNSAIREHTNSEEVLKLLKSECAPSYVDWMVSENAWTARLEHTEAILEIAKDSLVHCANSHFDVGYPSVSMMKQQIRTLAIHSATFAHSAVLKIASGRRGHAESLDHIFYGEDNILQCILLQAILEGAVTVVDDMINSRTKLRLTREESQAVLEVACVKDSAIITEMLLKSRTGSVNVQTAEYAALHKRSNFLSCALRHSPELACEQVGRTAYESRDVQTIQVALEAGCFEPRSEMEERAIFFIASNLYKKKRVLPPCIICPQCDGF